MAIGASNDHEIVETTVQSAGVCATELRVMVTAASAERFEHYFGIRRALITRPRPDTMYVVVADGDAVSLRLLASRSEKLAGGGVRRELVLEPGEAIVAEPARQSRQRTGSSWLVRWRAGKSLPLQESRTVTPEPADSHAEFLDRLLAAHDEELRATLWTERESGLSLSALLLLVGFNRIGGERVQIGGRALAEWIGILEQYPRSRAALAPPWPSGWVPVFVSRVQFAGVRWISFVADVDPATRPAPVTETMVAMMLYAVE